MASTDLETSCIDFIASVHGEQRRKERDISVRDLQAAVKYGTIERQRNNRCKVTYDNVIYITDETCTEEVTSYSAVQLPLEKTIIDASLARQILEQKRRIETRTTAITSHTVIVVDKSASMNNGDVMGHRSRLRAAYYTIANEMIAEPLMREQISFTDVVTIIEMGNDAIVNESIYMEPVSWELHNKLVDLAGDPLAGRGHGNYWPALKKSYKILSATDNTNCALLLIFVSDGRPSDASTIFRGRSNSSNTAENIIKNTLIEICDNFTDRLTFGAFGFANDDGSVFQLMQEMVWNAKDAGSNAIFSSGLDTQRFRKALFQMSTSLLNTRSNLSSLAITCKISSTKVKRTDIKKDNVAIKDILHQSEIIFEKSEYNFYFNPLNRVKTYKYIRQHENSDIVFSQVPAIHPQAAGIAIKKKFLGEGAERMAFEMTEVTADYVPVGQPLIAKISAYYELDQLKFHQLCARTQIEAKRLAKVFNKKLDTCHISVPKIDFLKVWFYTYTVNGETNSILSERRLDFYRYKKFNNNKGGVLNLNVLTTNETKSTKNREMISTYHVHVNEESQHYSSNSVDANYLISRIIDDDVPQAFSHWSFHYTKGDSLVCDLQGVLKKTFSLTDPAIHSRHRGKFGKTDNGKCGQDLFFGTHTCNPLCQLLRLPHVHDY